MVLYSCECCIFTTNLKSNYKRHLKTKKHLDNIDNNVISMVKTQKDPEKTQKDPGKNTNEHIIENKYYCEFCFDLFTTFAHKRRHELHRCKKNKNSKDILLNKQSKQIKKMEEIITILIC